MSGLILIVLLVGAFIAFVAYTSYATRQRRKELAAWAEAHALEFTPADRDGLDERFPLFTCLWQGDNRYGYNMMEGNWNGRTMLAFDYHYETHSYDAKGRRTTQHHQFSAVVLQSTAPLKGLLVRPEAVADKLAAALGFEDIDFESAEFSRAFYVKAEDRRWAYDVIHARTMEFLLSMPRFSFQMAGEHLIAYRNAAFSALEFEQAAEVARGLLDRLPEYLVREQQRESGPVA
jgi:hypothetical protein